MTRHRFASQLALLLGALSLALVCAPATAQPTQAAAPSPAAEIAALMNASKWDEALRQADAFLARNPRDAQVRFQRGVILGEQAKPIEAITVFEGLTRDFPELPEPHNNLAVLYAAQGRYEQARVLLHRALDAQPGYVTAYENLGDLHVSMAIDAYQHAAKLDAKNRAVAAKLTLTRELSTRVRAVR